MEAYQLSKAISHYKVMIKSLSKLGLIEELAKLKEKIKDPKMLKFLSKKLLENFQAKQAC